MQERDEEDGYMLQRGNVSERKSQGAVCLRCASSPSYLKTTANEDDAGSCCSQRENSKVEKRGMKLEGQPGIAVLNELCKSSCPGSCV